MFNSEQFAWLEPFFYLSIIAMLAVPLAIWKIVDIIIWVFSFMG